MLLIKQFLQGCEDSFHSILIIFSLYNNKDTKKIYNKMLLYNIFINIVYTYVINSFIEFYMATYVSCKALKIILDVFKTLLWIIPNYIIAFVYNGYSTSELIRLYIKHNKTNSIKLAYNCYDKYSLYIINKCYYQLIVIILLLETLIISNIRYIGPCIDMFCSSIIYSYYCWEFSWSYYKIPHNNRYSIFESRWSYYLGYGYILSIIKLKLSYLMSNYIIAMIFPIFAINTLNFYNKQHITSTNSLKLPLFHIPIKYANLLVNKINNYLINNK